MSHHIYYLKNISNQGFNTQYARQLKTYVLKLNRELPVIFSLKHLAVLTSTPYPILYSIVHRTNDYYRVFPIAKRNGDKRWISVPSKSLLKVQKWINKEILSSEFVLNHISYNSTAYISKKGHLFNAKQHFGNNDIIKLDITRFFESISERQVFHVFHRLGYKPYVCFILSRICTRTISYLSDKRILTDPKRWTTNKEYKFSGLMHSQKVQALGHLPQGAPTSPLLSNLVSQNFDKKIVEIANSRYLTYTRYADDLVLSGDIESRVQASTLISDISRILRKEGFKINFQKTKYRPKGTRQIITGICINDSNKVRVPKSYKDKVRQELYYIKKFGLSDHCLKIGISNPATYLLRLEGKIKYIDFIEEDNSKKMMGELIKAAPEIKMVKEIL